MTEFIDALQVFDIVIVFILLCGASISACVYVMLEITTELYSKWKSWRKNRREENEQKTE